MKVLVMNCSPVRNGATAEIVNIVSDCLKEKYANKMCEEIWSVLPKYTLLKDLF